MKKTFSVYIITYLALLALVCGLLSLYPKVELHLLLNAGHTSFQDTFFKYYSTMAEWTLYILMLLPLIRKKYRVTAFFVLSELSAGAVVQVLKHLFAAPRPVSVFENYPNLTLPLVEGVSMHHSNSFPSGHTSTFFCFFTCCALLLAYHYVRQTGQRNCRRQVLLWLAMLALLALAALGGYARIYLSQHFLSDVCVGSMIGVTMPCLIFYFHNTKSLRLSLFAFSCVSSVGILLLYNIPFFHYAASHANEETGGKLFLMASLVVVMLLINFMMTYLVMFFLRKVGRVILAILALINATALYFIITYNVIIDEITIGNVFNTKYSEASGFFSWSLWLFIFFLGVLPAVWCLLQPIVRGKAKRMGIWCGSSLAVVLVVALMNIQQTLWISLHDTELGGLLQPWSYLVNTIRVANIQQHKQAEEIKLPDGKIADKEKAVVVLVIGESARKANFQLYGYQRDTNPLLSKQNGLRVYQATSCATYTTAGTKAILEPKNTDDLYEVLPNYAYRTGADVVWRTSNWGEPPIHIGEYLSVIELGKKYPDMFPYHDAILFRGLRERIVSSKSDKVLIVLHTSTSHGPAYVDKYPKEFEAYKPVAKNIEEGEKNVAMLVNAYDNTIRYTDYLLSSLIDTLRTLDGWHSAVLFVSDHGESLGENKIFMHGLPMKLAPKVQYEIPFLVWTSDGFRDYKPIAETGNTSEGQLPAAIDQHYVFHSVLNLLSIQSPAYDKQYDIFKH